MGGVFLIGMVFFKKKSCTCMPLKESIDTRERERPFKLGLKIRINRT